MAHNLARAVGRLAEGELVVKATTSTLQQRIFPGRLATAADDDTHDYPPPGPGQQRSPQALTAIAAIPLRC